MDVFEQREDKISYLAGLIRLAKADGIVAPEEKTFFDNAASGLGLSDDDKNMLDKMWESEDTVKVSFTGMYQAAFFMQEAIQICEIDGEYSDVEKAEMRALGSEIGISEDKIVEIEDWVAEGIRWKKKGQAIVEKIAGR